MNWIVIAGIVVVVFVLKRNERQVNKKMNDLLASIATLEGNVALLLAANGATPAQIAGAKAKVDALNAAVVAALPPTAP